MANTTELVFILDKSGSMEGLEKDTIGGFNAMLEKQKNVEGDARITTVLFNDHYELLHDRADIKGVSLITDKEYYVGGTTALLDAIGKTIHKIKNTQKHTSKSDHAHNVIFVIITDGEENASREYSSSKVKKQISKQIKNNGWEFMFLGANIDAVETAESFGISRNRSQNFHSDSEGTELNYQVLNKTLSHFRKCSKISENWNKEIEADFKNRS